MRQLIELAACQSKISYNAACAPWPSFQRLDYFSVGFFCNKKLYFRLQNFEEPTGTTNNFLKNEIDQRGVLKIRSFRLIQKM
jgi:hypothetical protein